MTLAQLQSFVLVARHGSVKAAAAELGVTEPAVSVAVSALRKELGDDLFVREGRGIRLTDGGHRLAGLAAEILGLAEQARRSVQEVDGESRLMQVAVTATVAEHVGPLLDTFTARDPGLEVALETVPGARMVELLERRRADIALGPAPAPERAGAIATVPFLRSQLIVVAAPGHRLAGRRELPVNELERERWLLGPPELDPTTGLGLLLERTGIAPAHVDGYTSHAAAVAAAASGAGLALTVAQTVLDQLRRRALVRVDVPGTPMTELWHASTLGLHRAMPAALALQRFATTSEATQAISTGRAGTSPARARPRPHVTLWRSVGAG
jgi:DNA-binding transcriptional LysR family regulator